MSIQGDFLTGIANAIRQKFNRQGLIKASSFASEILNGTVPTPTTPAEYIAQNRPATWPTYTIGNHYNELWFTVYGDPLCDSPDLTIELTLVLGSDAATLEIYAADNSLISQTPYTSSGIISIPIPNTGEYFAVHIYCPTVNFFMFNMYYYHIVEMWIKLSSLSSLPNLRQPGVEFITLMSNLTDNQLFNGCYSLRALDAPGLTMTGKTNLSAMFLNCYNLECLDTSDWDVSSVTDMSNMFLNCHKLKSIDVSSWNTVALTNPGNMFNSCTSLETLDVSGWNMSKVTYMGFMFWGCISLKALDLSSWNVAAVTSMPDFLTDCTGLQSLKYFGYSAASKAMYTLPNIFTRLHTLSFTALSASVWAASATLTHDSILAIFNTMTDLTGKTAQSISLSIAPRNRLTAEELAIATNKNWTIQ